jgi:CheY-like chemotaxis protein
VALTAFARDTDRHIALEAGFQAHLGKPVNPPYLAEVLRHVMGLQ